MSGTYVGSLVNGRPSRGRLRCGGCDFVHLRDLIADGSIGSETQEQDHREKDGMIQSALGLFCFDRAFHMAPLIIHLVTENPYGMHPTKRSGAKQGESSIHQ